MKDNSKLAYNITDAAEYLAVSKSFVYMLRKKEIIKAIKVGRNYIFPRKEGKSSLYWIWWWNYL